MSDQDHAPNINTGLNQQYANDQAQHQAAIDADKAAAAKPQTDASARAQFKNGGPGR